MYDYDASEQNIMFDLKSMTPIIFCCFTFVIILIAVMELPIECPNLNLTTESDQGTYIFTSPDYGTNDVTLLPDIMYYPHGGSYAVNFSIAHGTSLGVGSHNLTTTIFDNELAKVCSSKITVEGKVTTVDEDVIESVHDCQ